MGSAFLQYWLLLEQHTSTWLLTVTFTALAKESDKFVRGKQDTNQRVHLPVTNVTLYIYVLNGIKMCYFTLYYMLLH